MTVEQKVLKPYLIKLVIWALLVAVLGTVCYFYHSQMDARFPPAVSISLIITVCAIVFVCMGLQKLLFDRSCSGKIVHINTRTVSQAPGIGEPRRMKWFNLIEITVECDNGKIEYLEEKRPMHLSVPYKIGDRIYHIKCSKYTCRFPFNKDKQSHSQTSTVCPLCGANLKLETKECSFCGCELPYDPNLK